MSSEECLQYVCAACVTCCNPGSVHMRVCVRVCCRGDGRQRKPRPSQLKPPSLFSPKRQPVDRPQGLAAERGGEDNIWKRIQFQPLCSAPPNLQIPPRADVRKWKSRFIYSAPRCEESDWDLIEASSMPLKRWSSRSVEFRPTSQFSLKASNEHLKATSSSLSLKQD